jgi:hypothetical protein
MSNYCDWIGFGHQTLINLNGTVTTLHLIHDFTIWICNSLQGLGTVWS